MRKYKESSRLVVGRTFAKTIHQFAIQNGIADARIAAMLHEFQFEFTSKIFEVYPSEQIADVLKKKRNAQTIMYIGRILERFHLARRVRGTAFAWRPRERLVRLLNVYQIQPTENTDAFYTATIDALWQIAFILKMTEGKVLGKVINFTGEDESTLRPELRNSIVSKSELIVRKWAQEKISPRSAFPWFESYQATSARL
jgi:hypothetical protein